jgi:hypothetical protein
MALAGGSELRYARKSMIIDAAALFARRSYIPALQITGGPIRGLGWRPVRQRGLRNLSTKLSASPTAR